MIAASQGNAEHALESAPLVVRLHRIEGQVRGLARMVEGGRPCDELLVQVSAARRALDAVAVAVLEGHVRSCAAAALAAPADGDAEIAAITAAVDRLLRGR